ncbi:MAG: FitA-like ribbon-helix-helix domain-containing protein [Asticcacaulis sp.]
MPAITVRNIPEAVHQALKQRAARHGRSTEAEIRDILAAAVVPREGKGTGIGSALFALGRRHGLDAEDGTALDLEHSKVPTSPMTFD